MSKEIYQKRFWNKVTIDDLLGCWLWHGSLTAPVPTGYGQMQFNGRKQLAHRISYQLFCGDIPGNMEVMHICDNRLCVNPAHLRVGSHADNMADMVIKGRSPNNRGEKNPSAKLTREDIGVIRKMYENGQTQAVIARHYMVTRQAIWRVVHQKSWNEVE